MNGLFWNWGIAKDSAEKSTPPPPPPTPDEPERVIEPAVVGKHFFADESSVEDSEDHTFRIWSTLRVIDGQCDGTCGYIFTAWNREDAATIIDVLDAAVDRGFGKQVAA